MIPYDFGYWGIGLIFKNGTTFVRAGSLALMAAGATFLLCWLARTPDTIKMLQPINNLSTFWNGWTVVITFLLVFRTNIAYGRYMEGIGLLQQTFGVWLNATSNLLAFSSLDSFEDSGLLQATSKFRHTLVRLMSLLFCTAVQEIAVMEDENFDLLNVNDLSQESLRHFVESADKLEIVMQWVQQLICDNHRTGVLWVAPPILSRVFQELSNGVVLVHDAMKITEYPFPFPYAQMLTIMLLAYTCTLPIVLAATMHLPFSAALLAFVLVFSQWSMNYIAAEIEMPFGDDPNDLMLREINDVFNRKMISLMHPLATKLPDFHYDPALHDLLRPEPFDMLQRHLTDQVEDATRADTPKINYRGKIADSFRSFDKIPKTSHKYKGRYSAQSFAPDVNRITHAAGQRIRMNSMDTTASAEMEKWSVLGKMGTMEKIDSLAIEEVASERFESGRKKPWENRSAALAFDEHRVDETVYISRIASPESEKESEGPAMSTPSLPESLPRGSTASQPRTGMINPSVKLRSDVNWV